MACMTFFRAVLKSSAGSQMQMRGNNAIGMPEFLWGKSSLFLLPFCFRSSRSCYGMDVRDFPQERERIRESKETPLAQDFVCPSCYAASSAKPSPFKPLCSALILSRMKLRRRRSGSLFSLLRRVMAADCLKISPPVGTLTRTRRGGECHMTCCLGIFPPPPSLS